MSRKIYRLMTKRVIRKRIERYVSSGFIYDNLTKRMKKYLHLYDLSYSDACAVLTRSLMYIGIKNRYHPDNESKFGGYYEFSLSSLNKKNLF